MAEKPDFDTAAWRKLRDARLLEWIGEPQAVKFVLDFSDACELFDDLVDRDKEITAANAVRVLFNLLTEMPLNPFFEQWKRQLIPLIVTGINAWLDANDLEKGSENDRIFAYVLRDWYMELIAFVVYLARGRDHMRKISLEVRRFFTDHESFAAYRERFTPGSQT